MFYTPKFKIFLSIAFITSLVPFCIKTSDVSRNRDSIKEIYVEEYSSINSINKAVNFIDSMYIANYGQNFDTSIYVNSISDFIKKRFYHGLSTYSVSDNWIAWLSGKIVWLHFSAIVNPDDILKHSEGLCSQQTIVFMELLKRRKINYRAIGLGPKEGPGHFLCEVYYDNDWHLYDIDKEPQWYLINNVHKDMNYYLKQPDQLYRIYSYRMTRQEFDHLINKISYGEPNEFPAKNMLLFHQVTRVITYIIPIFFLFLTIKTFVRKK